MTLKEAKKILKKEGYDVEKVGRPSSPSIVFTAYESPEICEAMQVVCSAGYGISMVSSRFDDRKARLSLELAENSAPMPGPGEEQPNEGNPALKEAASRFNDALLDEQAKKIAELTKDKENYCSRISDLEHCIKHNCRVYLRGINGLGNEIKRLGKEISRLNKIIHKKNLKIEELRKESSRHLRGNGENLDLEQELKDKVVALAGVTEGLRLSKIREKNLTDVCQKYVKENEKLKKKLAEKIVDKIDAQALKSAESALAYKEKVIAEKDEVIADLGNELAATKKELEEKTKLVEMVRKGSKEYREYGIAAEKMIQKMAKVIVEERAIDSEDLEKYRRWANGYRFNPQLSDFSNEEEKKLTAKMVDINAKCMRAARESINDVFESYAAKYAKSTLDELKDKAYESFNAKAHKLGLVGSKDGKGIPDQMIRVYIAEELSKVPDDVIDQFLLFGEIIIKEEK